MHDPKTTSFAEYIAQQIRQHPYPADSERITDLSMRRLMLSRDGGAVISGLSSLIAPLTQGEAAIYFCRGDISPLLALPLSRADQQGYVAADRPGKLKGKVFPVESELKNGRKYRIEIQATQLKRALKEIGPHVKIVKAVIVDDKAQTGHSTSILADAVIGEPLKEMLGGDIQFKLAGVTAIAAEERGKQYIAENIGIDPSKIVELVALPMAIFGEPYKIDPKVQRELFARQIKRPGPYHTHRWEFGPI